jgi:peroxiredoxin Q/BCP
MTKLFSILFLVASIIGSTTAQRSPLESGSKAPNTKFSDIDGTEHKISNIVKENDKVLLCFMRPVWCPVCNARTHELIDNYTRLKEKGYEIIVIYPTPAATLKQYVTDLQIPFTVVSDYNEELYGLFQVEKDSKKIMAYAKHEDGKKRMKKGKQLYKDKGKKYPVKGDKHGPLVPADFVLDKNQKLLNVYYGEFMGDHLPLDTL